MKHDIKITLLLVCIFLITQIVGLGILQANMHPIMNETTGQVEGVSYSDTGYQKTLKMENAAIATTLGSIFIGLLIGTVLVLLLAKFRKPHVWKYMFTFVVIIGLSKAFSIFINLYIALGIAVILALWKTFRPNPIIQNLTEIFIYGGIAAIMVQILNIYIAILLLILISIYDMIAVWQSKHMIKLAKFQIETKAFAGLSIPYKIHPAGQNTEVTGKKAISKATAANQASKSAKQAAGVDDGQRNAILGGGDMAFPLFFSGVLLETNGFVDVLVVPICAAIALLLLLLLAKKDRFYPAMPFITAGCFVGWGIMLLINLI
jgi:presenilin-like A22 family membrane protease